MLKCRERRKDSRGKESEKERKGFITSSFSVMSSLIFLSRCYDQFRVFKGFCSTQLVCPSHTSIFGFNSISWWIKTDTSTLMEIPVFKMIS